MYTKIQQKILSGNSLKLTSADWRKLKTRWTEVDAQGRQWLLKLDSSLPGKLGTFGHWLHDAETMLLDELALLANTDDNLPQLAEILRQHKVGPLKWLLLLLLLPQFSLLLKLVVSSQHSVVLKF